MSTGKGHAGLWTGTEVIPLSNDVIYFRIDISFNILKHVIEEVDSKGF
jgi:hypothetical protein